MSSKKLEVMESGLQVWLQPRLFDVSMEELLVQLSNAAGEAERLRQHYQKIHLNVGVEMTLFNAGFVPGNDFFERVANFGPNTNWPEVFRKLGEALEQARTVARAKFNGPLTYSAGEWEWEAIDWDAFDVIGIDHYMDETNRSEYVEKLRFFASFEKPVAVQEFGCCTYQGAENAGGMGWAIVDQENPDRLNGEYVRSERTQADYISRLSTFFTKNGWAVPSSISSSVRTPCIRPIPCTIWTWQATASSKWSNTTRRRVHTVGSRNRVSTKSHVASAPRD